MRHRIVILARGPLSFPSRKPGAQFAPSFGFVPGIALWGALGHELQRTPAARFGPALPAREGDQWVRRLPASAMSCKRDGGFTADGDGRHGVFDTLIDRACWEALRPAVFTYDPHCPVCLGQADRPPKPFYALDAAGSLRARTVQQRTLTRVAVDRRRGTAAEQLLYSPFVISELTAYGRQDYEPTRFVGTAWDMDGDAAQALAAVTAIGGRISSGLGRVTIAVTVDGADDDIAARLRGLNERFAARWALLAGHGRPTADPGWAPGAWRVFTVGLQSDAVLLDEGWRPSLTFGAAQLAAQTGLAAELVRAQASGQTIGGWNARWNRHRPTVLAAAAGSVYLFRTQADEEAICRALAKLEAEGVGERRDAGFGIVATCDPWHSQATGAAL